MSGDKIQAFFEFFGKGPEKDAEGFVSFLDKTLQEKIKKNGDTDYPFPCCLSKVVNRFDVFNKAFLLRGNRFLIIGVESALTIINEQHATMLFQWHSLC